MEIILIGCTDFDVNNKCILLFASSNVVFLQSMTETVTHFEVTAHQLIVIALGFVMNEFIFLIYSNLYCFSALGNGK